MRLKYILPLLFLAACSVAATKPVGYSSTDYHLVPPQIEKILNHHTGNVTYIASAIVASDDPRTQCHLNAVKYRNQDGIPQTMFLVVDFKSDQTGPLISALTADQELPLEKWYADPTCQNDFCPTERVRIKINDKDFAVFSKSGLKLVLAGTAGRTDLSIPASYFQAFGESFSQPPEWTSMSKNPF
jgi:hypothetical protein